MCVCNLDHCSFTSFAHDQSNWYSLQKWKRDREKFEALKKNYIDLMKKKDAEIAELKHELHTVSRQVLPEDAEKQVYNKLTLAWSIIFFIFLFHTHSSMLYDWDHGQGQTNAHFCLKILFAILLFDVCNVVFHWSTRNIIT